MGIFNEVKINKPKSNTFNLSHDRKMALNMGTLTPTLCMDILPGDKINLSSSQMLRFAPMIAPVMHRIDVFTHFFFVPNRLVWDNWENFITGGEDGLNNSVFPYIEIDQDATEPGTLSDFLGLPLIDNNTTSEVSALPFASYQKIYNEYYRDQNLIAKSDTDLVDGIQSTTQTASLIKIKNRSWQHDYFTSALPWTQKGPEATIPIAGEGTIIYDANGQSTQVKNQNGTQPLPITTMNLNALSSTTETVVSANSGTTTLGVSLDISGQHYTDLSSATSATINELRNAFRLQEFLEKNARGGSRYIEVIKSHFGVTSSDARLQRPEYLGGGRSPVTISEVLQTSETDQQSTPQGNMAGHGINVEKNNSFSYYAQEHGYIIGIMSIMPKTAYYQGIPKHFKKFDKFDYYFPSFAHLGEQPILTEEIFRSGNPAKDTQVFGYTPRYAEYKNILSSVHGQFKTSLLFWHLARKFDSQPYLNEEFINCDPDDTLRIFANENKEDEHIYAHIFHDLKATRLMPYFGTPKGV